MNLIKRSVVGRESLASNMPSDPGFTLSTLSVITFLNYHHGSARSLLPRGSQAAPNCLIDIGKNTHSSL